jgi:hypothetical protein
MIVTVGERVTGGAAPGPLGHVRALASHYAAVTREKVGLDLRRDAWGHSLPETTWT